LYGESKNLDAFTGLDNVSATDGNTNLLTLKPYERCNVLGVKKFMVRDLRTKLWLISGQEEGFNKFLPGRFGNTFVLSDNPSDYLPLRTVSNPNDYLLATFLGNGIRTVSNPYNQTFVIQVFIWEGHNVLGYLDESSQTKYLWVDDNGHISSVIEPEKASVVEIIEV
jgi:hypothetical protein